MYLVVVHAQNGIANEEAGAREWGQARVEPADHVGIAVELECQAVGRPSQPHRPQKELRRRQQQQQQQ